MPWRSRARRRTTPSRRSTCATAGRGGSRGVGAVVEQAADGDEVAERLRDLLALVGDHPGVHERVREGLVRESRRVTGAHLVVREDEVAAAALHADRQAEAVARDDAALDVPARTSRTDDGVPRRLPRARGAPEQWVERVALAGTVGVAAALGRQARHRLAVQSALVPERPRLGGAVHVEVEVVALGLRRRDRVGVAGLLQEGDGLGDALDLVRDGDVLVRRQDAERLHVATEQVDLRGGELAPVHAVTGGSLEQRVVDVGRVLRVLDQEPGVPPCPAEGVERQVGRGMAEVRRVVRRDAADVERGAVLAARRVHRVPGRRVVHDGTRALPGDVGDGRGLPGPHGWTTPSDSNTMSTIPSAIR